MPSVPATTLPGNPRTASCSTSSLAKGTHSIVANYAGDAGNAASSSTPLSQVITAAGGFTNGGFELPNLAGGYQYAPPGASWVFTGDAWNHRQRQRLHQRQPAGTGGFAGCVLTSTPAKPRRPPTSRPERTRSAFRRRNAGITNWERRSCACRWMG